MSVIEIVGGAILTEENQRRTDQGENGILLLCRSDLLKRMSDRIHGNQMILGSIGMMLLYAGLTNYFNVMIMGRYSRKQHHSDTPEDHLISMNPVGHSFQQIRSAKKQNPIFSLIRPSLIFFCENGSANNFDNRHES
jgi:hypothetical protein